MSTAAILLWQLQLKPKNSNTTQLTEEGIATTTNQSYARGVQAAYLQQGQIRPLDTEP